MKFKLSKIFITVLFAAFPCILFSQMYSPKEVINQYDPFTISIDNMTLSTNDADFTENNSFIIILTATIGNEKVIKFLNKDDITINSSKSYGDILQVSMTARKNNIVLFPAIFNIPNNTGSITIKVEGYSNINPIDVNALTQLSSSFCYSSSAMFVYMEQAFKYLAGNPDVNRPNSTSFTTAEVLQQNIKTRAEIFYLGNPLEVNYSIPQDPNKIYGTNIFSQGKKTIESVIGTNVKDAVNFTVTKYTDSKLVQAEPYYQKVKGVFQDLTSLNVIPDSKREGYIEKAQDLITNNLIVGLKQGVYINDQVVKQYTNLLNLLKAGVRTKSDTLGTTNDIMNSDEREALSYFESNIKDNDFNLGNQYVYDDYIASSVNRGVLLKEIDMIRKYYGLK